MRSTSTMRHGAVAMASGALLASAFAVAGSGTAQAARVTATCTNTVTDAATLQGVINATSPGDEVVIDGPCLITATVSLLGERSYRGDGPSTVLTAAPGRNLPAVLASDSWTGNSPTTGTPISLRDLTVDANRSANPTGGDAVVIRSWNTVVEHLRLRNAPASGLRVTNLSRAGTALTNSQVNGTIRDVFVTGSGQHGIYVQDSGNSVTDWNLLDNWVADSGGDAIRLENSAGWVVERNHVYGVGGAGINADRLFGTSLSDNYVEDFSTAGITVAVQGDAASTIDGNRVFQFSGPGTTYLTIRQVNYGRGQVSVTGNTIRGNSTGTGLSYQRGSNQLTVTSVANTATGVTTPRVVGTGVILNTGM